ncbi:MAG TPA: Nif3-like dinuclear metal center hexameric protein [Solirubrobacteraceae bacterium]|nr:Nif3-like dinuclear metal center hexameric protein [Solirubrobacteraceae bacterium]
MPTPVAQILAAADELLDPARFEDYCVNGLQVPGPAEATTIATAVSANAETFERAAAEKADLLLVHHGLFWGSGVRTIDAPLKRRLQILFDANLALAAYHLPLDAHPEIGNNALLGRALGADRLEPFAAHGAATIGCLAILPGEGLTLDALTARIAEITGRDPLLLPGGPETVQRVAIVSGAGSDYLDEAAAAGAQALLTGEPVERATATARELGVSLIAAGHHATETLGIKALGELLAARFALEHVYIEVENPV